MPKIVICAALAAMLPNTRLPAMEWTSWAGGDGRNAVVEGPAVNHATNLASTWSLNAILDASSDASLWRNSGASWSPIGASSPVVLYDATLDKHLAYIYAQGGSGFSATDGAIFAVDILSGQYVWGTNVGAPQMGSWSSPTYDAATNTILIGGGEAAAVPSSGPVTSTGSVTALNATTGAAAWVTPLEKTVVNATVAVGGNAGSNKAYITDYNGFSNDGVLYAINADPGDSTPDGAIDWQVTIGGTSGNTPTCHDGVVYVSSIGDASGGSGWPSATGQVYAFNAATGESLWQVAFPYDSSSGNPMGGLSWNDGYVYIASYEFYGDTQSASLLKIDATDTGGLGTYGGGDQARIVSESLVNRTDSIPLIWERANGEKVIVSSGGIQGFGTTHTVTFLDDCTGSLLGATSQEGGDSPFGYSGEPMGWAGNWTYQPVIVNDILYVAGPEVEWFGASNHLWAIDLAELDARGWFDGSSSPFTLEMGDSAVLADLGGGSSPAYYNGMVISYGPGGTIQTMGELTLDTQSVPEPSGGLLATLGAIGVVWLVRRQSGKPRT